MANEEAKHPSSNTRSGPIVTRHSIVVPGKWTYRSYFNVPTFVGDDQAKALALIFGEGAFTLTLTTDCRVCGVVDFGGGFALDIAGQIHGYLNRPPFLLYMIGTGRSGTPTNAWEYEYQAYPAPIWPEAVGQVPAFLGTVLRTKPHDGQPAGVTASFVMVGAGADQTSLAPTVVGVATPPGYRDAIRPKFRPGDVACMVRRGVKLSDYAWMSDPASGGGFTDHANARSVFDALSSGAMPPDTPWPPDWLQTYQDWMTGGFGP